MGSFDKLNQLSWSEFRDFLTIDRNYKRTEGNLASIKSRFHAIKKHFSDKELTVQNYRQYIKLLEQKYSDATINKYLTVAKRIVQCLELDVNLGRFAYRTEKAREEEVLTEEEIIAIANVTIHYGKASDYLNLRNKVLYLLAGLNGGNRTGEAINLKWADIRNAPKPHVFFKDTKSKDRKNYLSPTIWNLLQQLPRKSDYVFASYRGGKQLRIQEINIDLKRRAAACGINKSVHFYLLRTSYGTIQGENPDIGIYDLAEVMGNNPQTIYERYKKSTLEHNKNIILAHPSLKGDKPPVLVSDQLIKAVIRIVDRQKYPTNIEEQNGELVIRVKNLTLNQQLQNIV